MTKDFLPYHEVVYDDYSIRYFVEDCPVEGYKWHYDNEDRILEPIGKTDWEFQFDNMLPITIKNKIYIPKGVFHRIIPGTGDLALKIIKK